MVTSSRSSSSVKNYRSATTNSSNNQVPCAATISSQGGTIEQFLREEQQMEERLRLTRAFELCIKDAEERMVRALADHDSPDELVSIARSSLVPILGYDVVIRALAYAEEWQVRVVRVLNSKMPFIYELEAIRRAGQKCPHFYIYPGINFCRCKRFTQQVLSDQSLYTCEHVLGVRLAGVLRNLRGERSVGEDQMESILNEISTPNAMDDQQPARRDDAKEANVAMDTG